MTQNLTKSYLLELHAGIHVWGTDVMKLALYSAAALSTLNPDTITAYTTTNEVSGTGYTAGGVVLGLTPGYPQLSPSGARKVLIDFLDIGPLSGSGFTFRCGLIYNSSKQNRSVAVLDFGIGYVVTTSYGVVWPVPDDNNCIMRLGA